MNTMELVQFARPAARRHAAGVKQKWTPPFHELAAPARLAIARGRQWLLSEQRRDGSWRETRRGDATLAAQRIFLQAYSLEEHVEEGDACEQAVTTILDQQTPDGGWPLVPGGPTDLSTSVQAYFALKLAGHDPSDERLSRARAEIRRLGGADAADASTRCFLALFGQIPLDCCPAIPPEMLRRWRGGQVRHVGLERGVRELFLQKPADWPARNGRLMNIVPLDRDGHDQCRITDTVVAIRALIKSGMSNGQAALAQAAESLRDARRHTNWSGDTLESIELLLLLKAAIDDCDPDDPLPPELHVFRRRFHAVRETARRTGGLSRHARAALKPIVTMLLRRQNADGGWGSPASSPDGTGAALTALVGCEAASVPHCTDRGIKYLRSTQRADGSWDSASGVRLVHGTSLAVGGLLAAGVAISDDAVAAAVNWLTVYQQPSGGWGETAAASANDDYRPGPASAIQSAWALAALASAGRASSEAARRAVEFMLETQTEDGRWDESGLPLHDIPSGRWYASDLQTTAASLRALSQWTIAAAEQAAAPQRVALRLVGAP